jgi:hypothetical protein
MILMTMDIINCTMISGVFKLALGNRLRAYCLQPTACSINFTNV